MSNVWRIYLHMSYSLRYYRPPTQWRYAWPPDQLPPASFTRFPVASTIFMPFVERGNFILSTSNKGVSDLKSFWSF